MPDPSIGLVGVLWFSRSPEEVDLAKVKGAKLRILASFLTTQWVESEARQPSYQARYAVNDGPGGRATAVSLLSARAIVMAVLSKRRKLTRVVAAHYRSIGERTYCDSDLTP